MAVQRAEMRMIIWMCDIKVKNESSKYRDERHNLGTTAKQFSIIWACVAKKKIMTG